ncbi:putative bifunctional diguanylate cyclase/phosphodiesterase, partial [Neobacillus sp. K501]
FIDGNVQGIVGSAKFPATHDEVTGLPNRRYFDEKVKIAINLFKKNNDKLLAIMYFDLDRFKLINDSLGHNFGNMLLKQVAKKLKDCMRDRDIVSRSGSDEFIILLDNVTKMEISKIAERIQSIFTQAFVIDGHEIFVTPSIGISTFPLDGNNVDELIRKADVAMLQAKNEGRNNYKFYNSNFDKKTLNRLEIENDLRKALDRNEFILHYQPIMDLNANKMKGAEALIRWEHPQLGRVAPDKFIPIAEETGMIVPIGEWVLRTACQQFKNWQENGLHLSTISVNISFRQFYQPNLVSMIEQIVKETEIDPQSLTIEITESMTMDVEEASLKLTHLKNIGVNISIDDFGTGYSSLSYLKKFPIDYLKIDQSFIRDIAKSKDDENIATTILLMGQNLGLSVIAEGVEVKEQLEFLRRHECNEAQGYLFSKPLPANEIKELFHK